MSCLKIIANGAKDYLKQGGWVFLEHGFQQGEAVRNILKKAGFNKDLIQTFCDLSGNPRVSVGRLG